MYVKFICKEDHPAGGLLQSYVQFTDSTKVRKAALPWGVFL